MREEEEEEEGKEKGRGGETGSSPGQVFSLL